MDAGPSDRSFWINGVINVSLTVGYGTRATEAPRFPHRPHPTSHHCSLWLHASGNPGRVIQSQPGPTLTNHAARSRSFSFSFDHLSRSQLIPFVLLLALLAPAGRAVWACQKVRHWRIDSSGNPAYDPYGITLTFLLLLVSVDAFFCGASGGRGREGAKTFPK